MRISLHVCVAAGTPRNFSLLVTVFTSLCSVSLFLILLDSVSTHPPLLHLLSSTFFCFSSTCLSSFKGFLSLNHISISFHLSPPTPLLPPCSLLPSDCPLLLSRVELPCSVQGERECLQLNLVWLFPLTQSTLPADCCCPPQLTAPHTVQIPLCPPRPPFLLI